jgi:hypothetical protein
MYKDKMMPKREQRSYGSKKPERVKANMGRSMYNKGGQPHYSNGEMPKAKEL